jgi:hypothetical protein
MVLDCHPAAEMAAVWEYPQQDLTGKPPPKTVMAVVVMAGDC